MANTDPTRTTTLRDKYSAEFYKRFRTLKGLVRETVESNDALGLSAGSAASLASSRDNFQGDSGEKVERFAGWLRVTENDVILDIKPTEAVSESNSQWQREYVRSAYSKGIKQADSKLSEAGVAVPDEAVAAVMNRQPYRDEVSLLFKRNFNEIEGITEAANQQVKRKVADGLQEGLSPRSVAANINERLEKVGLTRARTLARTEVIRAHSEATLSRYEEMGVENVGARAEWKTAGDARVCPICRSLEGRKFSISEARGMLPAHPRCRCTWLPVTEKSNSNND